MNNKPKVIFFDLDHTLLNPLTNKPELSALQEAARLMNEGYRIGLASGKTLREIHAIEGMDLLKWDGYVTEGGGKVYDQNLNLLSDQSLRGWQKKMIARAARKHQIPLYCEGKERLITDFNEDAAYFLDQYDYYPVRLEAYSKQEISRMLAMNTDYEGVRAAFARIPGLSLSESCSGNIQIRRKGVHKAYGIHVLMKSWNLPEQQYICFGNGQSDLEMIQDASLGCAMNWSSIDVITYADLIAEDHGAESLACALQQLACL